MRMIMPCKREQNPEGYNPNPFSIPSPFDTTTVAFLAYFFSLFFQSNTTHFSNSTSVRHEQRHHDTIETNLTSVLNSNMTSSGLGSPSMRHSLDFKGAGTHTPFFQFLRFIVARSEAG